MNRRRKNTRLIMDMVKALRKKSREEEIQLFGKQVSMQAKVSENKKTYRRHRKHRKQLD
jgi:hypothetical protein